MASTTRLPKCPHLLLLLSLGLSFSLAPCAQAKLAAEDLQSVLLKAKVFDAQPKITVSVDGSAVAISTYRSENATEQDCKIDAVFAAKTAIEADSSISRVSVLFHDTRVPDDYYEVPVTLGDIAAYRSGQITKDQLLSALVLTKHEANKSGLLAPATAGAQTTTAAKQEGATAGDSKDKTSGGGTSPTMAPRRAAPAPIAAERTFSNYGVTFNYPSTWSLEYPHTGNTLAQLFAPPGATQATMVDMRVYSSKDTSATDVLEYDTEDMFRQAWRSSVKRAMSTSPLAQAIPGLAEYFSNGTEQEQHYEQFKQDYYKQTGRHYHRSNFSPLKMPETVNYGVGKSVHCLQRAYCATPTNYLQASNVHDPAAQMQWSEYIHCVVFECKPYVIQLDLFCPYKDAYAESAQFTKLMDSLKLVATASKTPKAATAKPAHK
jgi:hypothetical protein